MSTKTSLNRKEDFWSWWCYSAWILFSLCFAGVMTAIILYYWNDWSIQLKGVAAISVILPIHVVEEWVFPGGFHYQYNTFAFHSDIPDRLASLPFRGQDYPLWRRFRHCLLLLRRTGSHPMLYAG